MRAFGKWMIAGLLSGAALVGCDGQQGPMGATGAMGSRGMEGKPGDVGTMGNAGQNGASLPSGLWIDLLNQVKIFSTRDGLQISSSDTSAVDVQGGAFNEPSRKGNKALIGFHLYNGVRLDSLDSITVTGKVERGTGHFYGNLQIDCDGNNQWNPTTDTIVSIEDTYQGVLALGSQPTTIKPNDIKFRSIGDKCGLTPAVCKPVVTSPGVTSPGLCKLTDMYKSEPVTIGTGNSAIVYKAKRPGVSIAQQADTEITNPVEVTVTNNEILVKLLASVNSPPPIITATMVKDAIAANTDAIDLLESVAVGGDGSGTPVIMPRNTKQSLDYTSLFHTARLINADTGDAGMPKGQKTAAIMFITGDSQSQVAGTVTLQEVLIRFAGLDKYIFTQSAPQ